MIDVQVLCPMEGKDRLCELGCGKQKLLGIGKSGNSYLRRLFVQGARAALQFREKQSSGSECLAGATRHSGGAHYRDASSFVCPAANTDFVSRRS